MKKKSAKQKKIVGKTKESEVGIVKRPVLNKKMTSEKINCLVENLQTHQVELEAQNEELRTIQAAKLESARDKYQDLYDFSPIAYLTLNTGDIISDANLTASSLIGISRSKLCGTVFKKLVHRDDQDIYYMYYSRLVNTGERQFFELKILRNDGSLIYAHIESMIMVGRKDEIGQIRMSISDITRRVKAEEAMKESELRFRTLFNEAAEGIAVVDAETRVMLYSNRAVCDLFGYSNDEMMQISVADLHPPEALQLALGTFELMRKGSVSVIQDLPCQRKNGTIFYADIRSTGVYLDGKLCLAGYFTDVTSKKLAIEQERLRVEELKTANEDLARFNRAAVNREMRMIELKKEINDLCAKLGLQPRYELDFEKESR